MGFNRFNPCICCPAEVGVYILSFFQLLYITGAFVIGGAFGYETLPLFSEPESVEPFPRKAILLTIFIIYSIYCLVEVGFHEYLQKTLNLQSKESKFKRCRRWVIGKLILFVFSMPIVCMHLFVDMTSFKMVVYWAAVMYQLYFIWVVQHFTVELDQDIKCYAREEEQSKAEREASFRLGRPIPPPTKLEAITTSL